MLMMKTRKTVALIFGGRGYESEVSLRGEENIRPIIEEKYNCLPVYIDKSGRWLVMGKEVFPAKIEGVCGFFCPKGSDFFAVDCAFPLLHGDFGEDGIVQGALECASIPYVGCDSRVGAICRDKAIVKAVAERLGIPTLPYLLAEPGDNIILDAEKNIGYPMFIKPTSLGSSVGACEARSKDELVEALEKAFSLCNRVIIEKLLEPKRELECGYFKTKCKELFTNAGEIVYNGGFYDYDRKYKSNGGAAAISCANLDSLTNRRIKDYAGRLVRFLGVRDLSRIDFFLSDGELYFNEINTMPGFTGGSLYAAMLEGAGVSTSELISELIEGCLYRG